MINETVVAISTPLTPSGVGIIRLSGKDPLGIAKKMFKPVGKTPVEKFEPNKMYAGEIQAENFSDFGFCVFFKGPKSFTGEDTIEFHSHGGVAITKGILKKALSLGARLATRGEFTKMAFLNGKLSLASCEGLIDMINSESESGVRAGYSLYTEKLTEKINELQDILLDVLSQIDVDMDFPEEDLETVSRVNIKSKLNEVIKGIDGLLSTYQSGNIAKNGVKVGIVGKPNTGKSSILNALLNYEKAIVSSVAGTTRDIVEGSLDINGVRFNFFDTAGIRESDDEIENIGIRLSKKIVNSANVLLFVLDGSDITSEDQEIFEQIKDKNLITVLNKTDKGEYKDERADLNVSALTGENIDALRDLLYSKSVSEVDFSAEFLCEERHYEALKIAKERLLSALNEFDGVSLDIASIDIKLGWESLGEITGKTASEEIINNIFMKFCVGK